MVLRAIVASVWERTQEYVNNLLKVDVTTQPEINMDKELCDNIKTLTFNLQQSLNLPKPELLSFSGNPAEYC